MIVLINLSILVIYQLVLTIHQKKETMMMQYYLKPTKLTNGGKDVGAYYGTCDYNIEYNDNNRPTLPIGSLLITYICGKPLTPPYFIAYDFLRYDKILYSDPCMSSDD